MDYRIFPPEEILETSVQLPPSKSIGARTLIMDFIGSGVAGLSDTSTLGDSDDIATLREILSQGIPTDGRTVDVGDSGTALRMLTALYAASEGCRCRLTGSDSLRKRPVGPLVDALRALGAEISYAVGEGRAPLEITGRRLAGGTVELDASLSSQFATALMLTAPLMAAPLTIKYSTPAVSAPYVRLTAAMMSRRGVAAHAFHKLRYCVAVKRLLYFAHAKYAYSHVRSLYFIHFAYLAAVRHIQRKIAVRYIRPPKPLAHGFKRKGFHVVLPTKVPQYGAVYAGLVKLYKRGRAVVV